MSTAPELGSATLARTRASRRRGVTMHTEAPFVAPIVVLSAALLSIIVTGEWLAGAAIVVLWGIWHFLTEERVPPVLALALSFQWLQVTVGVFYIGFTGRELEAHYASDYRPMVMIGLGCIVALAIGLIIGLNALNRFKGFDPTEGAQARSGFTVTWRTLFIAYIASTAAGAVLTQAAGFLPGLAQGILAMGFVRLGALFLMFRRLVRHRLRWEWFFGLVGFEIVLGFTGYFANFREPLMLAIVAILEVFRPRSFAHWLRLAMVAALLSFAGLAWIGIRTVYRAEIDEGVLTSSRAERLGRVTELSGEWLGSARGDFSRDFDKLVERVWTIYYPALAVSRVPEVLPHENGAIMSAAVRHIFMPRILFPNKGTLPSDSDKVRKYSGVYVAGVEEGTSIAFGYAAEAYVDFGVPWMFIPSILFGAAMGVAYRVVFKVIHHQELAVGLACVVFWLALYLFERSWVMTLGFSLTLLVYVGALVFMIDRLLLRKKTPPRSRGASSRLTRVSHARAPR